MSTPNPMLESGDGTPSLHPLYMLMPYLWPKDRPDLRLRVVVSLVCLALSIAATTVSPVMFGWITDRLAHKTPANIAIAAVFGLIVGYVLSRILMQAFAQLRDGIFAKVQYHALREVGVSTFAHVHTLSPALSSGAQDRRPVARHRARHQGHRHAAVFRAVQHLPDLLPASAVHAPS